MCRHERRLPLLLQASNVTSEGVALQASKVANEGVALQASRVANEGVALQASKVVPTRHLVDMTLKHRTTAWGWIHGHMHLKPLA